MSILQVNLGTYANDGTGDDLRSAFEKVNANFNEIDLTRVLTAANLGGGAPLFYDKVGTTLRFRSIVGGQNIELGYNNNEVTISTVNLIAKLEDDLEPTLGGNLNLNEFDITGQGNIIVDGDIIAVNFQGNLTGNVTGQVSDISNHSITDLGDVDISNPLFGQTLVWDGSAWVTGTPESSISNTFDFGRIGVSAVDPLQLALQFTNIDFDTFSYPSTNKLDFGPIDLSTVVYNLSRSSSSILEGQSIIITLQTYNVPDGTFVPYEITGITQDDLNGSSLLGSFIVMDGYSSVVITTSVDANIEGTETATLRLLGTEFEVSIDFNIEEISSEIDGGSPSSAEFLYEIDGGSPSSIFAEIIDGGGVFEENDINGGFPETSVFTTTADGGNPSTSSFDEEYNGGLPA
jgi:hypothetical protein